MPYADKEKEKARWRERQRKRRRENPDLSKAFYERKETERRARQYARIYDNASRAGSEYSDALQNGATDYISPFDDPYYR